MLDPQSHTQLQEDIAQNLLANRALLDQLRSEIRPLRKTIGLIMPRIRTSTSLVESE